jgi:predicted RNA-binding protein (virulence factor B family)
MIELGKIQTLTVIRKTPIGLYLNSKGGPDSDDLLLPNNQAPRDAAIGAAIEVFVYRDSEDRMIATVKRPKLTIGELAFLQVVEVTEIGAFLDWGLEKDLFLPFREQREQVVKGGTYLVGLYIDKSNRLSATTKIANLLSSESPYKVNERVRGIIYSINPAIGAFVAVADQYHGLIPVKELYENYTEGDRVEVRIKKIQPDGKLELSVRNPAKTEIEGDAAKIMERLAANGGTLPLNDHSAPEQIKAELSMSKAAFKRAVGRLLKEGAVKITVDGLERMW